MIDRKLASGLAVEDRDQPLVGIPLNGAFGGDPFRAARPAGAVRAVRDVKDHRIERRTDAADRRPVRVLRLRAGGRDKADQSAENGSASEPMVTLAILQEIPGRYSIRCLAGSRQDTGRV